jgi:SH3-like domain-containing protein
VFHSIVTPAKAGVPLLLHWFKNSGIPAFAGMTLLMASTVASAQDKKPPYWASIASGQAMMRTGPARNYPGTWLYQRRDLPIRVLKTYPNWRFIEDPDGTQGWMLVTLLSDRRTAIVRKGEPRPVRTAPNDGAKVRYLAEPGVVGRIGKCRDGWCRIAVGKKEGYIRTSDIWGVSQGEVLD